MRSTASHLIRYGGSVIVGTMLFLALAVPVVLLNLLVGYLGANYQTSTVLLPAVRVSQFVLVTVDLMLFSRLLLRATVDLLRRV